MRIEVLATLKGSSTWRKGTVFDDAVSPIPGDILKEVGSSTVKVMAENPFAVTKTKIETEEPVVEESPWGDYPSDEEPQQEKTSIRQPEVVDTKQSVCTECGWTGKTEAALKRHMTIKHR